MRSKYPWAISLCGGGGLQFTIADADGDTILLAEMYREADLLTLLDLFQRHPEIRLMNCESVSEEVKDRKYARATAYLDALPPKLALKLLKANGYNAIKAAQAGELVASKTMDMADQAGDVETRVCETPAP